ncbi:JAB domain-containing protein [Rodentibacter caecimuris]|uniref:DNA repair protein RadC n=1 Tax=Rodentibacter caecimuris TaxID=1796644 RepID=A0AAJ3K588_9PAST|nr:JAB domain-containing protein [Rodentibacter heylii]OOF72430.1 DNA repair protein RadC [Rodentibacter heylii]OOF75720.1 DNA repair protein RadC [Rodentibacter heylii]
MYQLNANEQTILNQAKEILTKITENTPIYRSEKELMESEMVAFHFQTLIGYEEREMCAVLFLDCSHRLLKAEILFQGNVTSVSISPREVIKRALQLNAVAIVIGHNHPSGNVVPSYQDQKFTEGMMRVCRLMEVDLLDHIIVFGSEYYSFSENSLLID